MRYLPAARFAENAARRIAADRALERPARRFRDAARDREVRLADGARLERGLQRRERRICFRLHLRRNRGGRSDCVSLPAFPDLFE